MKNINKFLAFFLAATMVFAACTKVEDLPVYEAAAGGPVLTASTLTFAPLPADSNAATLRLNWTKPSYSIDSATVKYVIEIDSSGRNFSRAFSKTVSGALTTTFINKEINSALLAWGFAFNTAYDVDVRVTSSHANNNELLRSNTLKIRMTPYKIPPKVALPTSGKLFLVGDASQGGWNNPVPTPTQEFARIDETTFAGVFTLNGNKEYLILPVNGDWNNKFSVPNKSLTGLSAGGSFAFNASDNFPSPATTGTYLIRLDFQSGTFTVTPYTTNTLPANLFIVGDATVGGWNNPVPVPTQQLTRLNSCVWQATLPMVAGKEFLLLPVNGEWTNKYAVGNKTLPGLSAGGVFGYNASDNFPGPAVAGNYQLTVNFATSTFTNVRQ